MPLRRPTLLFRYSAAIASVAVATWLRYLLDPLLGEHFPFGFAYIAVLFSAWLGGWGPSLVAFTLGLLSTNFLFIPPRYDFSMFQGEHQLGLALFTMIGLASILMSESLHLARLRAERSMREARDKARALETEIIKRIELEEQLRQHAHELAEAHRRKDEFLGMLAHELRNPLAPVRNGLEVLKQLGLEDTPLERVRVIMERQVNHLIRLINDLLDVSRITQGRIQLQKERLELKEAIGHALEMCQPLLDARRHQLELALPQRRIHIDADPVRFEQILGNLLGNAAKYTQEGGSIRLQLDVEGRWAVLRLRDNGMGIAPDAMPSIFEPFQRSGRAMTSVPHEGLGIGLTLVRRLVELHGGTITAHSEGHGRGSEFIVRLPVAEAGPSSADSGILHVTVANKHKVLVVDDNVDAASSLAMVLRLKGHNVRVAHDGTRAIEIAREECPEFAFLDLGMPSPNGYEVARVLRTLPELQHLTLIALTGYGQEEHRIRSREAGFDLHLVKPIDAEAVEKIFVERDESLASA